MSRKYQYTVVAYDNVGIMTVEYTKRGKPTVLRRVPLNITTPEEEILDAMKFAVESSAPWDIWDIDDHVVDKRLALVNSAIGKPNQAELPAIMEPPVLQPLEPFVEKRAISESDYRLLWDDGLVDIHPDVFFGRKVEA